MLISTNGYKIRITARRGSGGESFDLEIRNRNGNEVACQREGRGALRSAVSPLGVAYAIRACTEAPFRDQIEVGCKDARREK